MPNLPRRAGLPDLPTYPPYMEGGKAHSCCYWPCAGFPTSHFWVGEVTPDHLLCTPDHPLRNPPCTPPLACVRRTDPSPFLLFSSLSLTFDKISTRNVPSSSKTPTRARFQGVRCTFLTSRAELACQITHLAGGDCCLLYTSPSPRDGLLSRMPSSA